MEFFYTNKKKEKRKRKIRSSNHAYRACDTSVCISPVHDQIHGDIFQIV